MISQIINALIVLTITSNILEVDCQDRYTSLKALRNDLLANYDRYNRPVKQPSTTVNVTIQLAIHQITDLDIRSQTFHVDGYLIMAWKDEFLTWDPAKYSGIKRVKLDSEDIWTPDIINYNMAVGVGSIGKRSFLAIENNGQVVQGLVSNLAISCLLDLTDYPFDKQICILEFGSWAYNVKELNLIRNKNGRLYYGPYYDNPEWRVDDLKGIIYTEYTDFSNVSVARLTVQVSRRVNIHLYYIFLPYLTASLMGIIVFLLPIGSYYRLVFSLLALFILINLLIFLAFNLGFQSLGVPYAIRCISVNIMLITISLIVTNMAYQLIMNLIMTCPPLPSLFAHHLANPLLGRLFCLPADDQQSKDLDEESNPSEFNNQQPFRSTSHAAIREWIRLLRLIDRLLFLIYIIALIFYHS